MAHHRRSRPTVSPPSGFFFRPEVEQLESRILLDGALPGLLSPNQQYVATVYQELVQQPIDPGRLAGLSATLDRGGSRQQIVLDILRGDDYRTRAVQDLYLRLFDKPADRHSLAEALAFLKHGGLLEQWEVKLLGSDRYYHGHSHGTNLGFLAAVYRDVFHRRLDPSGLHRYSSLLDAGVSREALAGILVHSLEAERDFVDGLYRHYLGHPAPGQTLAALVRALQRGARPRQILADVLSVDEYFARFFPTGTGVSSAASAPGASTPVASGPTGEAPAPPVFDLASTSATSDHQTSAARVLLIGRTDPQTTVTLMQTGATALSDGTGVFQFPDVSLQVGDNSLTAQATDSAGLSSEYSATITRLTQVAGPDAVLTWDQAALETIRQDSSTPQAASRALAMESIAVGDAVNALDGTPTFYVHLTPPADASAPAAVSAAAYQVLSYLYPNQQAYLDSVQTQALAAVPDGQAKSDGVAFGQAVGNAVIASRQGDGWNNFVDDEGSTAVGQWRPTPPAYAPAQTPQWANLQPFAMTSPGQFLPPPPPALDSQAFADAFNEVKTEGSAANAQSSDPTVQQDVQIARFWADGAGTYTPPGHWNQIAEGVAQDQGNSLSENARLFEELNVALGDAGIVAWNAKFTYNFWRPITAIQNADQIGNPQTQADPTWQPLIVTPNFPSYVSGHSTFSAAAAAVLTGLYGANYSFDATTLTPGIAARHFDSFQAAAEEAGQSRIYGGIHYQFDNQAGLTAGGDLGNYVLGLFNTAADTQPPRIVVESPAGPPGVSAPLVFAGNVTVQGQVLDNLSGVASLQEQTDGGAFTPVTFDADGNFQVPTTFATDGTADGTHTLNFQATDFAGNTSGLTAFTFTLDTQAPTITLTSPADGGTLDSLSHLTGTADGAGSAITQLTYAFEGGTAVPVAFTPDAGAAGPSSYDFDQVLDLSHLAAGPHSLTVTATNAAGQTAATTVQVNLPALVDFTVTSITPLDGATDVGATFRPEVTFSRPVDPSSLNDTNFFATGPDGQKIPATIVPSDDGTYAWLFFTNPLPGAARITLTVDGSTIRAANGDLLDADMSGTPGSKRTTTFTTVSLTAVAGTSLFGTVADPGPDLKPFTLDDVRAGPDQTLMDADDVYLLPIAHVHVYILGMQGQAGADTYTDASGNFNLTAVPAGDVKLVLDGNTAANPPAGYYFPEMVMDLTIRAGQANTVMGSMGTPDEQQAQAAVRGVYLPRLLTSILHPVSDTGVTHGTVDAASALDLSPEQRQQLSIDVQPGSLVGSDGKKLTNAQIGISVVPPELVMEMLPAGLMQHTFDITIQAPGVATLTTPAAMTFPNVFGAAPGTKLNFLSFNHTTGRLEIDGTATVSADGLSVTTDPGSGITHPGWHGLAPMGSPTAPACDGPPTNLDPALPDLHNSVKDYFFTSSKQTAMLSFSNDATPLDGNACSIKNMAASQMQVVVDVSPEAKQFLKISPSGTKSSNVLKLHNDIRLQPGQPAYKIPLVLLPIDISKLTTDLLYGADFTVTVNEIDPGNVVTNLKPKTTYYLYRYLDASDDNSKDNTLLFNDTVNDGTGTITRARPVAYRGNPADVPQLQVTEPGFANLPSDQFNVVGTSIAGKFGWNFIFDPTVTADDLQADLHVTTRSPSGGGVTGPGTGTREVIGPGSETLAGNGVAKVKVYANLDELKTVLTQLATGVDPVQIRLDYNSNALPLHFRLKLGTRSTDPITVPLSVDAAPDVIQAALEQLLGAGNGDVTGGVSKLGILPNGSINFENMFTITPKNALLTQPTPQFVVTGSSGSTTSSPPGSVHVFTATVQRAFNNTLETVTPDLRNYLSDPANLDAFAQAVFTNLTNAYAALTATGGMEILPGTGPTTGTFTLDWTTSFTVGLLGKAVDFDPILQQLGSFVETAKKYNPARQSYLLKQILDQNNRAGEEVQIYLNNFFGAIHDIGFDPSPTVLETAIAQTAAHETGHALGLPHVADFKDGNTVNAFQTLEISGGGTGDTFTLSFAGEMTDPTHPLPRLATAMQVQDELRALPTITAKSDLVVQGPDGGPYSVYFVDPAKDPTLDSLFAGVNVPQITGSGTGGITVTPGVSIPGDTTKVTTQNVKIGDSQGINDIMRSHGKHDGTPAFQQRISLAGLRVALPIGTASQDVTDFISVYHKTSKAGLTDSLSVDPDTGQPVSDPEEEFVIPGKNLDVFNSDGDLAPDSIDFGTAVAGAPSGQGPTQQLTLLNSGSDSVTLHSVQVTGSSAFSVSPVAAGTVLQPGDTLNLTVTFAPQGSGSFSATLIVDSDASSTPTTVDLAGTGQSTTGSISLQQWNNNVGGVQVGYPQLISTVTDFLEPTVVNTGAAPLTITGIRVATGHGQGEYQVDPTLQFPVVVQPGASFSFSYTFQPSAAGLRPGAFEVLSDDPQTPVLRIPVVGTGATAGETPNLANDYVAVSNILNQFDPSAPALRQRTDAQGNWNFFLPPNSAFNFSIFDPTTGLVADGFFLTNSSGVPTNVVVPQFGPSTYPDTVGNGLPDDVKFAIGLNPNKVSTTGDGISDFDKLALGIDPLAGQPTTTGVLGAVQLGTAQAVVVDADPKSGRHYAYVAGSGGLSVVDVTNFNKPTIVGQLGIPGGAVDVDVDPTRQLAAVALGSGLALVNVADPTKPVLLQTVPVNASLVKLFDGVAYVAAGTDLHAVDATTGEDFQDLPLGTQPIESLARDGTLLLALATDGTVSAIDLSGPAMVLRDSLAVPAAGNSSTRLFAADGKAWIAAPNDLLVVDYSQPDHLLLGEDVGSPRLAGRDMVLNGSGLALVGATTVGGAPNFQVISAGNPGVAVDGTLLTAFRLPDSPVDTVIAGGIAYVADSTGGLQIVNYLPFDEGTTPPTVQVAVPVNTDIDPTTPGIQVLEATRLTLVGTITDDVQVRDVQLLLNGVVVKDDLSYPSDLTVDLPRIKDAGSQVVLQVAATDTGGTTTLSAPIDLQLVPDTTPPAVVKVTPADGSTQPLSLHTVTMQFSKSLDPTTVTPDDFSLIGPGGALTPLTFSLRTRQTVVELNYLPLAAGTYQLVIHAAAIKDLAGNALGTADMTLNFTMTSGSPPPTITWINPNGGFWDDPTNWSTGVVPGPTDDVGITIPVTAPIILRQGTVAIHSLFSTDPFEITGGTLHVAQTIKVNNQFLISSPTAIPTVFSGTVLRGDGGQGITIEGYVRLVGASVQTDMTLDKQFTRLFLADDFTLLGTASVDNSLVQIEFDTSDRPDGAETIFAGTFASQNNFPLQMTVAGNAQKVTFDKDVTIQAQGGYIQDGSDTLDLVNHGTITSVNANAAFGVDPFIIDTGSMENDGVLEATNGGGLVISPVNWTNLAAGKIIDDHGYLTLGRGNLSGVPAGWSNAGTITATGADPGAPTFSSTVVFQSFRSPWSNTGTISLMNVVAELGGQFTSADVQGLQRSGGIIGVTGLMDNTGRTFTFNDSTGSWLLEGGTIRGGIINVNPAANDTLDSGGGTLDGVTVNGDLELGGPSHQPANPGNAGGELVVVNGFTLNGTMRIDVNVGTDIRFQGAQTVSKGLFVFQRAAGMPGDILGLKMVASGALHHNVVTLGPDVAIETATADVSIGGLENLFDLSTASFLIQGQVTLLPPSDGNPYVVSLADCDNQGTIHTEVNTTLGAGGLKNEGTITADSGSVVQFFAAITNNQADTLVNTGTINATNAEIDLGGVFVPADIGTINRTGGSIHLVGTLENAGNTFVISAANSPWFIAGPSSFAGIKGGTVQVVAGGDLRATDGGFLQDVTVDGDINAAGGLALERDVTINGTVTGQLFLGDPQFLDTSQQNIPLVIHAGTFNVDSGGIQGYSYSSAGVTFGPGVTLTGGLVDAPFAQPLLNEGTIRALPKQEGLGINVPAQFTFDNSVITNQGTLTAASLGTLQINHLAPNAGILAPDAGGTVAIGSDLAETAAGTIAVTLDGTKPGSGATAAQYSQVTVAGAATLDGTLTIQLGPGYQPNVGDTFPILTYASHTGTFATVNAPTLPNGESFQVVYGAKGVSLVVVQNQLAAGVPPSGAPAAPLTEDQARAILAAAIQLWAADGVGAAALARMRGVDVRVAGLGGNQLAQYDGRAITLDDNADGFGWFVDPTPLANEEFTHDATDSAFAALANGPAAGHMDLLTVVAHELGHVIGLGDDVPGSPGDLMSETLPAGVRRLPG
jgi:hypothetical protein